MGSIESRSLVFFCFCAGSGQDGRHGQGSKRCWGEEEKTPPLNSTLSSGFSMCMPSWPSRRQGKFSPRLHACLGLFEPSAYCGEKAAKGEQSEGNGRPGEQIANGEHYYPMSEVCFWRGTDALGPVLSMSRGLGGIETHIPLCHCASSSQIREEISGDFFWYNHTAGCGEAM